MGSFFRTSLSLTLEPFRATRDLSWNGRLDRALLFFGLAELLAIPTSALVTAWLLWRANVELASVTFVVQLMSGAAGNLIGSVAIEPLLFLGEHLVARVLGGRGTMGHTARAHCMGAGGNLLLLIPVVGLVSLVTLILARAACLSSAHRFSRWKGFVAVLAPLVVLACGTIAVVVMVGLALRRALPH